MQMGYLSCRADSSIATCRSLSSAAVVSPSHTHKSKLKEKNKNKNNQQQQQQQQHQHQQEDNKSKPHKKTLHHFTYAELQLATNNFSDSCLLGRGSHGSVYKATLPSHLTVAVKRPSPRQCLSSSSSSSPTVTEVDNEISILSQIHSPRLVNLLGFTPPVSSSSPHLRLLVVEFMPNGTLFDLLHNNNNNNNNNSSHPPPSFPRRLKICLQIAKAILTLHSACPPIIHRDIKSANVLLDAAFNARLSDFGLALNDITNGDATPPAGTLGYLDPAYVTPDNLSTKTDVFSFGILLLEIMSGRKAIDVGYSPPSVVDWAVPLLRKGKVGAIYDKRMGVVKDGKVRRGLAVLAASCVRGNDERRPGMAEVVEELKVFSKMVREGARAWNGPCSVVDTQKTLTKINTNANTKVEAKIKTKEDVARVGVNKTPSKPLRNGTMVFADLEGKRGSRNLMELLARPDGEIIEFCGGESSVIRKARNLRVPSESCNRLGTVVLRQKQTVKKAQFVSLAISDGVRNSDGRSQG